MSEGTRRLLREARQSLRAAEQAFWAALDTLRTECGHPKVGEVGLMKGGEDKVLPHRICLGCGHEETNIQSRGRLGSYKALSERKGRQIVRITPSTYYNQRARWQ